MSRQCTSISQKLKHVEANSSAFRPFSSALSTSSSAPNRFHQHPVLSITEFLKLETIGNLLGMDTHTNGGISLDFTGILEKLGIEWNELETKGHRINPWARPVCLEANPRFLEWIGRSQVLRTKPPDNKFVVVADFDDLGNPRDTSGLKSYFNLERMEFEKRVTEDGEREIGVVRILKEINKSKAAFGPVIYSAGDVRAKAQDTVKGFGFVEKIRKVGFALVHAIDDERGIVLRLFLSEFARSIILIVRLPKNDAKSKERNRKEGHENGKSGHNMKEMSARDSNSVGGSSDGLLEAETVPERYNSYRDDLVKQARKMMVPDAGW
ncbi:hypothetical protein BDK51DRAFT_30103 [Blyttiomyces helicus]|uniref:Uncharacterized protein n=1 Tax=Blyttiomyces helicus TaxID=388810 RepID=A0A4P9W992_9FUNG|nr:hypothetical protein BDK51DRAFT_30103 [Blyttiomyces helicus]|eukprot:RKO87678.1 hypothetical protein BDK51DRAFT_30103 [Blyttiomyces helicus]